MMKNSFKENLRDKAYDKMKYSVEKYSLIVVMIKALDETSRNLFLRIMLLLRATITRTWCHLWMGVYQWLVRIPICAFYCPSDTLETEYNRSLKFIFDNKDKLKPLHYEKERDYEFMVFYSTSLLSLTNLCLDDSIMDILHDIANSLVYKCSRCGCGILGSPPYTYRSNNGCVSKKYECHVCREYDNRTAHKISDYRKKHGSKATIMKVLKDESQMEDTNEKEK